jgi:CO/xanthine dehydrogenase FAD-binding subunit
VFFALVQVADRIESTTSGIRIGGMVRNSALANDDRVGIAEVVLKE